MGDERGEVRKGRVSKMIKSEKRSKEENTTEGITRWHSSKSISLLLNPCRPMLLTEVGIECPEHVRSNPEAFVGFPRHKFL